MSKHLSFIYWSAIYLPVVRIKHALNSKVGNHVIIFFFFSKHEIGWNCGASEKWSVCKKTNIVPKSYYKSNLLKHLILDGGYLDGHFLIYNISLYLFTITYLHFIWVINQFGRSVSCSFSFAFSQLKSIIKIQCIICGEC